MAWKKLASKEILRNRWLSITEDKVKTDTGLELDYTIVRKQPFALIIPWDGTHVTLVGQYRYAVDFDSWEFPQGHFEHETILETAQKELKEETGLRAQTFAKIGSFFIAPGAIDQECHVFLATGLQAGRPELEPAEEGLKTRKVTLKELRDLIKRGQVKDGPTIAASNLFSMTESTGEVT